MEGNELVYKDKLGLKIYKMKACPLDSDTCAAQTGSVTSAGPQLPCV